MRGGWGSGRGTTTVNEKSPCETGTVGGRIFVSSRGVKGDFLRSYELSTPTDTRLDLCRTPLSPVTNSGFETSVLWCQVEDRDGGRLNQCMGETRSQKRRYVTPNKREYLRRSVSTTRLLTQFRTFYESYRSRTIREIHTGKNTRQSNHKPPSNTYNRKTLVGKEGGDGWGGEPDWRVSLVT